VEGEGGATGLLDSGAGAGAGAGVETETTTVVLTGTTVDVTDPTGQLTPAAHAVMVYDWVE
jgi:hypothetical protein